MDEAKKLFLSSKGVIGVYRPLFKGMEEFVKTVGAEKREETVLYRPEHPEDDEMLNKFYREDFEKRIVVLDNADSSEKNLKKIIKLSKNRTSENNLILICGKTEKFIEIIKEDQLPIVTLNPKDIETREGMLVIKGKNYKNIGAVESREGDYVIFKKNYKDTIAGIPYEVMFNDTYIDEKGERKFYTSGWEGPPVRNVYRLEE